jgi:mannose-6-phosphate isomerase-like protein (cupin superfamily)
MSVPFATLKLPTDRTVVAPDGSDVRVLLALAGGSMAHFTLKPGAITDAVVHRTVEELWFVLSGCGEMWRKQGTEEATVALEPGLCLSIPVGTRFQFRAAGTESLTAVAVTLPPWPGDDEAVRIVGPWVPSAGMP